MITPCSRVVLEKKWEPHLKASPIITQFKEDITFIFLSSIANQPEECIVYSEQSGKLIVGRTEYFEEKK